MTLRPPRLLVVGPQDAPGRDGDGADDPLGRLAAACGPDAAAPPTAAGLAEIRDDAARVRQLASRGTYTRPPAPSAVVYRLQAGDHRQTGVVVEVPVEDYRTGRVRRHEATRPAREHQLSEFLAATGLELVPVTLTHPTRAGLQELLEHVVAGEPDVSLAAGRCLTQTVWVVRDPAQTAAIFAELAGIERLYIADGHHRMAAAEHYAARRHRTGPAQASDFVLGALFPAAEMRVLGYHRCITRPEGMPAADLLEQLARQPVVEQVEESSAGEADRSAPGMVSVHVDDRWYRLTLGPSEDRHDARAALDVVAVEDEIIGPVFGIDDLSSDPRVTRLPGTVGAANVAGWCVEHGAVGFVLHPPSVEQVMAVSDADLMMPAKSTWFDPKAGAGPFVRDLL